MSDLWAWDDDDDADKAELDCQNVAPAPCPSRRASHSKRKRRSFERDLFAQVDYTGNDDDILDLTADDKGSPAKQTKHSTQFDLDLEWVVSPVKPAAAPSTAAAAAAATDIDAATAELLQRTSSQLKSLQQCTSDGDEAIVAVTDQGGLQAGQAAAPTAAFSATTLCVFFRCSQGSVQIEMKKHFILQKPFQKFKAYAASQRWLHLTDGSPVVFRLTGDVLDENLTPFDYGICNGDTIDVVWGAAAVDEVPASGSAAGAAAEASGSDLQLKVACKNGEVNVKIGLTEPLSTLVDKFTQYAVAQNWVTSDTSIRFVFDGDKINGDDTPQDLDCEGGEVIEAQW